MNGPGFSSAPSGGDVRMIEIARRLVRTHGVEVGFLTTEGGRRMLRQEPFRLHVLDSSLWTRIERSLLDRGISYVVSTAKALFDAGRFKYDAVVTASDFFCDVIPAIAVSGRCGARWIASVHHRYPLPWGRPGNLAVNAVGYLLQRSSFSLIARYADQVWVHPSFEGECVRRTLAAYSFPVERIHTVLNGIEVSCPTRETEKLYDACFVGGARASKGVWDLPEIWRTVVEHVPDARLALRCSGPGRVLDRLRLEFGKLGIAGSVVWVPELSHCDLCRVVLSSRLFLTPSYEEGWGIALSEALGLGVPAVGYDLPSYRGTFDKGMVLVPRGDRRALGEAAASLLANPSHLEALAEAAIACTQQLSWDRAAERDLQLLQR